MMSVKEGIDFVTLHLDEQENNLKAELADAACGILMLEPEDPDLLGAESLVKKTLLGLSLQIRGFFRNQENAATAPGSIGGVKQTKIYIYGAWTTLSQIDLTIL